MRTTSIALTLLLLVALVGAGAERAQADVSVRFAYTSGSADVRVWLDRGHDDGYYQDNDYDDSGDYGEYEDDDYDVYPSVSDAVLYVRAARNTYATVYVVDTDGFVHVVHPFSPYESSFIEGRRVYKFYLSEYGFDTFDRGIAYAYAVTSPVPFNYDRYGDTIFGASYGYRIYGDPYVGARKFYLSIVAGHCDRALIGIGHSRFYVREYVRYPSYLCVGWHNYYGSRRACRRDCSVFGIYSHHVSNPYRILRPHHRLDRHVYDAGRVVRGDRAHKPYKWKGRNGDNVAKKYRGGAKGQRYDNRRVTVKPKQSVRNRSVVKKDARATNRNRSVVRKSTRVTNNSRKIVQRKQSSKNQRKQIVRSSKTSYDKGKSKISTMRKRLDKQQRSTKATKAASRASRSSVAKKSTPAKRTQASKSARSKSKSKSKKSR